MHNPFTFISFMAQDTLSFVDVRFMAYNKNPDNNKPPPPIPHRPIPPILPLTLRRGAARSTLPLGRRGPGSVDGGLPSHVHGPGPTVRAQIGATDVPVAHGGLQVAELLLQAQLVLPLFLQLVSQAQGLRGQGGALK